MQIVSDDYKSSMKQSLRERGYQQIILTLQDAQTNDSAHLAVQDEAYYSSSDIFETVSKKNAYITFEEHYTTVDGSMKLLPPKAIFSGEDDNGFVSDIIFDGNYQVSVNFGGSEIDIEGILIDFGDNYPNYIKIENDKGIVNVYKVKTKVFSCSDTFSYSKKITVTILNMQYENRVRINRINFIRQIKLENGDIEESSLESQISLIGETLPQINFSVKIINSEMFGDIEKYFDRNTGIQIYYGYDIPGKNQTEWLPGGYLFGERYEKNRTAITIYGWDILQNLNDVDYYKGYYGSQSAFDILVDIFDTCGITDYSIDPKLNNRYITNPIPVVTCKEALQIVCNACQCNLEISRIGQIVVKYDEIDANRSGGTDEIYYSDTSQLFDLSANNEYINFGSSYTTLDGSMRLTPPEKLNLSCNAGYVSKSISGADGVFEQIPEAYVFFEKTSNFEEIKLTFGEVPVDLLNVRVYSGENLTESLQVYSNSRDMKIRHSFKNVTKLIFDFLKTKTGYNHAVLNGIRIREISDFVMETQDMLEYPETENPLIKDITVVWTEYSEGESKTIYSAEQDVEFGNVVHIQIDEPAENWSVNSGWKIVESGCYYADVMALQSGTMLLELTGTAFVTQEKNYTETISRTGESITWDNPLVSTEAEAAEMCAWLKDYYQDNVHYSYQTRGNPELDVHDRILQKVDETEVVTITGSELNFNGAFSGKVEVKRNE